MDILALKRKIQNNELISRTGLLSKIRSIGIYLLVPICNFAVSIFSTPYFAKHLSAEEFGYFGFYTSVSSVISVFLSFSFNTYYLSIFHRQSETERKKTLVTITLFLLLWNLVCLPLSYLGTFFYLRYSGSSIPVSPFLALTLVGASIGIYKIFLQSDFRLKNKPFNYFLIVAGHRLLSTVLSLYFVVNQHMGLSGRMIGVLIVEIGFIIISLLYILPKNELKIDKQRLKEAFRIILPLLPASLLYLPLLSYDNFILERMNQPAEMGLYNIGKSISYYLYIALFPFFQVFESEIYKNTVKKDLPSLKKIALGLFLLVCLSITGFWLLSDIIVGFLTSGRYRNAVIYANITAITSGLMIIFSIGDAIINALQKTKNSLLINAISAVFCISLCHIAAAYFGQIGVAFSIVISFLFLILLQAFVIIRTFK
jgi:O-antigen/teichoic acid export membrane protein